MHTIRPARKDDLSDVIQLWNVCLPYDKVDRARLESFFEDCDWYEPDGVLVAEAHGTVAGFIISIGSQTETGWIPVFFVDPQYADSNLADALLGRVVDCFRARGITYAKVEPFGSEVRFFTGIDSRYTKILGFLARNGFERTDESQVDIVKDLANFKMPAWVRKAVKTLRQEGITFSFCEPQLRGKYLQFMMEHFGGYSGWCEAAREYVESGGDPRLRVLALLSEDVVGFTVYAKERDWYISATGVREDLRLKKIGSVLLFTAFEEMRCHGADRVCVSNCPIEFYKVVEGEVVRRYVMMGKALKGD